MTLTKRDFLVGAAAATLWPLNPAVARPRSKVLTYDLRLASNHVWLLSDTIDAFSARYPTTDERIATLERQRRSRFNLVMIRHIKGTEEEKAMFLGTMATASPEYIVAAAYQGVFGGPPPRFDMPTSDSRDGNRLLRAFLVMTAAIDDGAIPFSRPERPVRISEVPKAGSMAALPK